MVINMNESRLCTIEQIKQFFRGFNWNLTPNFSISIEAALAA